MPDSKPQISREQHARIESLANEHSAVVVYPINAAGIVKVQAAGRTLLLNEDGDETLEPIESIGLRLSVDLVRRMLGADIVDGAIEGAIEASYPDYAVGRVLQSHVEARIAELLATSETVERRVPFVRTMARTNTVEDAAREARDTQDVGHRNVGSRQMDVDEAPGRDEL